jgi:long-chain-fatty-acid---luciferin-component ligase
MPGHTTLPQQELDDLLEPCFDADDPFGWWNADRDEWWSALARAGVAEMLATSPLLREMASFRPGPGHVSGPAQGYRDLLVPSAIFKRGLPVSDARDVVGCSSSGTMGSVSSVPRDDATLQRFLSGVRSTVRTLIDLGTSGFTIINLVPSVLAPRAPWTSYIVAGMAAAHPTIEPGARSARDVLAEAAAMNERCMVIGAPHDVLDFAERVGEAGRWGGRLVVVTVGGWKSKQQRALSPVALRSRVSELLGVDERDIRDGYGMVELNSVLIECAEHRKHVPPWLEVVALSPRQFEPVPGGTEGLLAFFDPTATSFPGFVLSEDAGVRHDTPCPCGVAGPTLTGVRRLALVEARGCALTSIPQTSRQPSALLPV